MSTYADAPVIGVVLGARSLDPSASSVGGRGAGQDYLDAIVKAGGKPVLLAPSALTEDQAHHGLDHLSEIDGLLFTGGGDLHPSYFGRELDARTRSLDERRDAFELGLLAEALARDVPALGICRGEQLLNVVLGGTLYLDLPSELGGSEEHMGDRLDPEAHLVSLAPESFVASLCGCTEYLTNSAHHQAVRELGSGLRAVGWSPGGVIEAVESSDYCFCVGLQWHPERLPVSHESRRIFEGLVAASMTRKVGRE